MESNETDREARTRHMDHPDRPPPSVGSYLATRLTTLRPPMIKAPNPVRLIRMLNRRQWAFFMIAFWAWVCLAFFTELLAAFFSSAAGLNATDVGCL